MKTSSGSSPIPVSVVVITRNEEHHIEACIRSLQDFSQIVIVDNGSTDATIALASPFSNVTVLCSEWKGYGATRQVGVDAAQHDWILWMDADERMSAELVDEIKEHLSTAEAHFVFTLPRRNYFLGQHIRGCGWSPDRVTRLFHRGHSRFDEKIVHEGLEGKTQRKVILLTHPIEHYSYLNAKQFFEKNLRYALLAADERRRLQRRVSAVTLVLRPVWEFFSSFILKRGFLDGLRGFVISAGAAAYVFYRDTLVYFDRSE